MKKGIYLALSMMLVLGAFYQLLLISRSHNAHGNEPCGNHTDDRQPLGVYPMYIK